MSTTLADYVPERQAFEALFQDGCRSRILLFEGASGSGKTTLLSYCQDRVPNGIAHVPIQLRGNAVSVAEIFYRSGSNIGWERLPAFNERVDELQGAQQVKITGNRLSGINNRINVALRAENVTDRDERRAALTEALFDDLSNFAQPLLFVLDTFEQATTEVKDWISGPFLARASLVEQVRTLVAGQTVPDVNNIEWKNCCTLRKLYGVPDATHWLPVVQDMNRTVPFSDPLTWLAGVCFALKGDPSEIMKVIEALPSR
jgi:hypothetical protein